MAWQVTIKFKTTVLLSPVCLLLQQGLQDLRQDTKPSGKTMVERYGEYLRTCLFYFSFWETLVRDANQVSH